MIVTLGSSVVIVVRRRIVKQWAWSGLEDGLLNSGFRRRIVKQWNLVCIFYR